MKFPLALLSVAFSATLAQAATIPTGLLAERCTPGTYHCNEGPTFVCAYYDVAAIVRISTHDSLLLIVLDYTANHMPQLICDSSGYGYTPVACCGKGGCKVINGEPHCI